MNLTKLLFLSAFLLQAITGCNSGKSSQSETTGDSVSVEAPKVIKPRYVTEQVLHDTDDPAIWINSDDPAKSLIIGTDKGGDTGEGGLYVFSLEGKIDTAKSIVGLGRPNNVDIEYGLMIDGKPTDIAVTTERNGNRLMVYSLPDMKPLTERGIEVFIGETERSPMGIALYKRPSDGSVFAVVGRKSGPSESYLWQYLLEGTDDGQVKATLVRKFGKYSGVKEIEAIAVDDQIGFIYYSDERVGVRKYHADPALKDNSELAFFATEGFADDHEGLSVYSTSDSTGYIIVSDQGANKFHFFTREGSGENPHDHRFVKALDLSTLSSDGNEVTSVNLGGQFSNGMFVAMSDDRTFHIYSWEDLSSEIDMLNQ